METFKAYSSLIAVLVWALQNSPVWCVRCYRGVGMYIKSSYKIILSLLILALSPAPSQAGSQQPLSQVALFHRCYAHLTGKRASFNHPLLQQVRSGAITAVNACMEVLDQARFDSDGEMLQPSSEDGVRVIHQLYQFHRSWFSVLDLSTRPATYASSEVRVTDPTEPALFLTHLLLNSSNPNYKEAFTGRYSVRAKRSEGAWFFAPPGTYDPWRLLQPYSEARAALQYGELRGVSRYEDNDHTWFRPSGESLTDFNHGQSQYSKKAYRSYHGGIMGLSSFLWMNGGFDAANVVPNGADRMPRKWVAHIMSDLLCRDLPVLRLSDVSAEVDEYLRGFTAENRLPYRSDATCASCHSTTDPASAAIRNLRFIKVAESSRLDSEELAMAFAKTADLEEPSHEASHMIHADSDFEIKKPKARLRYRSFSGELKDSEDIIASPTDIFDALSKLGDFIAAQDDAYVCAAARYFHFFTGIQVNLSDPGDERSPIPTESDLYYKNIVVGLGQGLKSSQKLRSLIEQILSSEIYQKSGMRDLAP